MRKLAVLLSGSGRTLDNFHQRIRAGALRAEIQVVVSNVASALGLEKARRYGYPAFHAASDAEINGILAGYDIDLIALAGYLKLYTPPPQLRRSVLNIHPALIPSFCGAGFYGHHVHEAVKAKGCTVLEGAPISVIQTPRPRAAAPGSASGPAAGAADAKIDPAVQRARDSDARRILEGELQRAQAELATMQKEYNNGQPERLGSERNFQRYLDRVADMKAAIARKESDIAAIQREIAKLPQ